MENHFTYSLYHLNKDDPSSSSSPGESIGYNLLLQPLFICPSLRLKASYLKKGDAEFVAFPLNIPSHYPNKRSLDQLVKLLSIQVEKQKAIMLSIGGKEELDKRIESGCYHICKLPVVPLFWCNNRESTFQDFKCGACQSSKLGTNYYFCVTCCKKFHKECVESPLEIKHPSYPLHSLQLSQRPCELYNCIVCRRLLEGMIYYCPTYQLFIHPDCAMKPVPIFKNHPKRHPHALTIFPKQDSLACNVCGLIKENIVTYVCVRCVFVVHEDCIYFPNVIRISRHHHRISFTSFLPSGNWSCGVCRKKVDNNCGAYSCNKCNGYFVHSRCALRGDVCDGKELEGVPEEPEIVVEPFERIADGIIHHFSHDHHLKLEINRVYGHDKYCQGCILPVYEGQYYSCMDKCDFILHESCANAPRKIYHALHPSPLELVTNGYDGKDMVLCTPCGRFSNGFVYQSSNRRFTMDLRCASISEPFKYQGHEHPLFLALYSKEEEDAICEICQNKGTSCFSSKKLNCIECNYIICFKCANLPYKAWYKHDKHFLTFRKAKEASDHSEWCEACERKIADSSKEGFYTCDNCCTTLHVHCLFGKDPNIQPGHTIKYFRTELQTLGNNTQFRPFCDCCKQHCPHRVVYEKNNEQFCSLDCVHRHFPPR